MVDTDIFCNLQQQRHGSFPQAIPLKNNSDRKASIKG
jgi:hypothetical protein